MHCKFIVKHYDTDLLLQIGWEYDFLGLDNLTLFSTLFEIWKFDPIWNFDTFVKRFHQK